MYFLKQCILSNLKKLHSPNHLWLGGQVGQRKLYLSLEYEQRFHNLFVGPTTHGGRCPSRTGNKRHFFSKANKKRLWTYVLAKKLSERTIIRSPLLFGFYQMYGSDRINGHEMPQLDRLLPRSSSPFPSRVPAPRCSLL